MTTAYRGTLKEKAEADEGEYKLTVEIPAFKSKYPTILTRVPAADAQQLTVGQAYAWLLERGNLKQGKKEGSNFLYDYWWNYKGIGEDTSLPAAPTGEAPRQYRARTDPTGRSIERQVALKAAVEYAGYRIQKDMALEPADILAAAEAFARWLAKGPQTTQEPQGSPSKNAQGADDGEEAEGPF